MKKWFLFLFVVVCFTLKNSIVKANSDYKAFQEIEIMGGKFLSEFSSDDYKNYYSKVSKRKFWGWRVYEVNSDKKVVYKTETLFSYYNDGTTSIDYDYSYKKKNTKSRSLSSTGTINVDASGTIDKFKGGLSSSLKIVDTSKIDNEETEEFKLKAKIDPGTMLNLYITGEGKISNGVAANYIFWIRKEKGGFEVFTITTQYYRMEKVKI